MPRALAGIRRRSRRESLLLGPLMAAPAVLVVGVLIGYPLVRGFQTSIQSSGLYGTPRYIGLANYRDMIHDPGVAQAIVHTIEYLALAVTLELVLGLAVAVTLHRAFRGRGLVLALLVLPWALPSVVSGVLWRRVFDPDNGLLNSALLRLHLISEPQLWLSSSRWAIALIALVHVWGVLPLIALTLLAGLQSIPDDVYSASAVDGASPWRQFRHITLPMLRPSIAIAVTLGTLMSISIFDEIYVLNGTALNTRSVLIEFYNTAFVNADFAHGTALAFLLAACSALLGGAYVVSLRRAR